MKVVDIVVSKNINIMSAVILKTYITPLYKKKDRKALCSVLCFHDKFINFIIF